MSLQLLDTEVHDIQVLVDDLAAGYRDAEDEALLREIPLAAHELPRRVRAALHELKLREPASGLLVVSGFPVRDEEIGPTPGHWRLRSPAGTLREEICFLLLGALLGEPVAWSTQQAGHVVHDILPVRGHEGEQLGTGSEQLLWWHTEDAFHPHRGDYIGMMCLRNPDGVATTIATLENVRLDARQLELLFEPHYTIRPDESHLPKHKDPGRGGSEDLETAYSRIEEMQQSPDRIAVLFGDPREPYLRLDPFFMGTCEREDAQSALRALIDALDRELRELVLRPGDICFIDNYRAVHGRKPFQARYDGRDRWLKRLNIARDLRKSRAARPSAESRVIG